MNHLTKFQVYCVKRKAYDEAHAISGKAWKEMEEAERDLVDSMNEDGVAGFETVANDNGSKLKVSLRRNFAIAVNKDNEFLIREWLTEKEGDVALFTKEELNKSAISQLIKQKVADGQLDEGDVPAFFKLRNTPSVMVRGWNKENDNAMDKIDF